MKFNKLAINVFAFLLFAPPPIYCVKFAVFLGVNKASTLSSKILSPKFYNHDDVVKIAQQLLGKIVISQKGGLLTSGIIVETEAYKAPEDKASHAFQHRRTPRNETMYANAGIAYIYKCYGIHDMLNVVTAPKDIPHAVLIRAIEPLDGINIMQERRGCEYDNYLLTGGPGKICQAMSISVAEDDGKPLFDKASQVLIYDGIVLKGKKIKATPRVGMSHHTGEAGHWPWRFYIEGNKWVSRPLEVNYNW